MVQMSQCLYEGAETPGCKPCVQSHVDRDADPARRRGGSGYRGPARPLRARLRPEHRVLTRIGSLHVWCIPKLPTCSSLCPWDRVSRPPFLFSNMMVSGRPVTAGFGPKKGPSRREKLMLSERSVSITISPRDTNFPGARRIHKF